jgi:hypothetical protein
MRERLSDIAADFLLFQLDPLLNSLGCSESVKRKTIDWFVNNCAGASSVDELKALVTARVRHKKYHSPAKVERGRWDWKNIATPRWIPGNGTERKVVQEPDWRPCKHFGGTRECERCKQSAARKDAGKMATADAMYRRFRPFVLKRIHGELQKYTGGKPYPRFEDLEGWVWSFVAEQISSYKGNTVVAIGPLQGRQYDHPMAWLQEVTHTAVIEWFKHEYADKRDARKTLELNPDLISQEPLPIGPSKPTGHGPDEDEPDMVKEWRQATGQK